VPSHPAGASTLVYDGDCGFCTASARFLARVVHTRATLVPWQEADLRALELTVERARGSVQWVGPPGGRSGGHRDGARAIAAALRSGRQPWPLMGAVVELPGVVRVAQRLYHVVSANRHRLPGSTPACALPPARRPGGSGGGTPPPR